MDTVWFMSVWSVRVCVCAFSSDGFQTTGGGQVCVLLVKKEKKAISCVCVSSNNRL